MRTCKKCYEIKMLEDFGKGKNNLRVYTCKKCLNLRTKQRLHERGLMSHREYNLLCKYKMTVEDYDAMLKKQEGVCAICKTDSPGGRFNTYFGVDHDHGCCPGKTACGKCNRGLLCHLCNSLLGHAKDSPEILRAAIAYLEN